MDSDTDSTASAGRGNDACELTLDERRAAILARIDRELPANPRMGDLASRAEALAEARELAEQDAPQAGSLVRPICRTLIRLDDNFVNKGKVFLAGAYDANIRRDGLFVLAEVPRHAFHSIPAEQCQSLCQTVLSVLENTANVTIERQALRTLATITGLESDLAVDWRLENFEIERRLPDLSAVISRVFAQSDTAEQRHALLRAVAVLASHDQFQPRIAELSVDTLEEDVPTTDYLSRVWLCVISQELGLYSPVDPDRVWTKLSDEWLVSGLSWWLLWQYGAAEVSAFQSDAELTPVLRQTNAQSAVVPFATLPDSLAATHTLVDEVLTALSREEPLVRVVAVRTLLELAEHDAHSATTSEAAVKALESASCPAVVPILVDALDHRDEAIRKNAAEGLGELALDDQFAETHRDEALTTLTAALSDDGRELEMARRRLATGLAEVTGCETLTADRRAEALRALVRTSEHDDKVCRLAAVNGLSELVSDIQPPAEYQTTAVDTLVSLLDDPYRKVRSEAMFGLAMLAGTDRALEYLPSLGDAFSLALTDEYWNVRVSAVRGCRRLALADAVPVGHRTDAVRGLSTALHDERNDVRFKSLVGLTELAEDTSNEFADEALRDAFTTALEHSDDRVRVGTAMALAQSVDDGYFTADRLDRLVDVFRTGLGTDDPVVRLYAIQGFSTVATMDALSTSALRDAVATLEETFDGTNRWRVQEDAAVALPRVITSDAATRGLVDTGLQCLLGALDDSQQKVREAAARGICTVCHTVSNPAELFDRSKLTRIGDRLSIGDPVVVQHLLVGLQALATSPQVPLDLVLGDVRQLLTGNRSPAVQTHALEFISIFGDAPTGEVADR